MVDLNSSFKATCRTLLGQEVGELEHFRPWLLSMVRKPYVMRSALSNKEVHLSLPHFSPNARFIGQEELDSARKAPALDMNSLKDIDSIRAALGEQAYCGNKLNGQCINVRASDTCTDCIDVLESAQCLQDQQTAYSYAIRKGDGVFGCFHCGEVAAAIRSMGCFFSKRLFDAYLCTNSSDLAFCFNCRSCTNSLFSFNQSSTGYLIGNRPLPKDKYLALRSKLMGEVAATLKKDKRFPSIFELVGEAK